MMKAYILHGWTYSLDKWQEVMKLLKTRDIEPIMLRVPGLTADSKKVWNISDYVDWLDDELKKEKAPIVIGHSNGGRIALAYAQAHPGRLRQLVLIDSAGVPHNDVLRHSKLALLKIIAKAGKPLAMIPGTRRVFYKLIGAQDYLDASKNMKKTMQHMLAANDTLVFSEITVPTTIIWGKDDTYTPLRDGEFLRRTLPNAQQLYVIDTARHAPFHTHPQEVANLIADSLRKDT